MPTLPDTYRPCVGMMVHNDAGEILVGQRIDRTSEAWQMPQGGIDPDEDPKQAALRELQEEIGTSAVEIRSECPRWLYYDLPEDLVPKLWGGRYRGQAQRWFLMYLDDPTRIRIDTPQAEFSAVRWVPPATLPELIVPFKRALYQEVLAAFSAYLPARAHP